jgi:hypothetical protein
VTPDDQPGGTHLSAQFCNHRRPCHCRAASSCQAAADASATVRFITLRVSTSTPHNAPPDWSPPPQALKPKLAKFRVGADHPVGGRAQSFDTGFMRDSKLQPKCGLLVKRVVRWRTVRTWRRLLQAAEQIAISNPQSAPHRSFKGTTVVEELHACRMSGTWPQRCCPELRDDGAAGRSPREVVG